MLRFPRLIYLVVTVSVIVVALALLINGSTSLRRDAYQPATSTGGIPPALKFTRVSILDGKTKDGAAFANYVYRSSDCSSVSNTTIFFGSSSRAYDEIQNELQRASVVLDRGSMLDDKGQWIGERIVFELNTDPQTGKRTEIAWNAQSDFHSIVGPSLHHVVELEKSLRESRLDKISGRTDFQRLLFTPNEVSESQNGAGIPYSEQKFQTSDCETVSVRTMYFRSPVDADEEFKKQLSQATNIVEQGAKLNAVGQRVGVRAVAMLKAERLDEPIDKTVIVWTDGSEYHSITGPNAHALEFERRNLPKEQ